MNRPAPLLTRRALAATGRPSPAAPVRIVHLGLGAFHRAHQAWYTARAADSAAWGIEAYAGRSGSLPDLLAPQDGLFTLVERGAAGDTFTHIGSLSSVQPASTWALCARVSSPRTAIITITVTEAGYTLTPTGTLDLHHPDVAADIVVLRKADPIKDAVLRTMMGRLVAALEARRRAGGGPIAIVPCDNFPHNGPTVRAAVLALAQETFPALATWIISEVSFVSTSVDRITPRVEESLVEHVEEATGWRDRAPLATEPFADWTLAGDFPAGRPDWSSSGATFVDNITPYEDRKLWLLNGAHTLLATEGRLRGHRTVAEAIEDPVCLASVGRWWDEAERQLPASMHIAQYRSELLARFRNPRIAHQLEQISSDSLTKVALRVVPVALRERAAGRDAVGAAAVVGAWIALVRSGLSINESQSSRVEQALTGGQPAQALLATVSPALAADQKFCALTAAFAEGSAAGISVR